MIMGNDRAEVLNRQLLKLTLVWLQVELVLSEALEDFSNDLLMMSEIQVHNEDVVKVHPDVAGQDEVLEDVIHHYLEGRRGIGQAKVHHQGFEKAPVGLEHGFPLVTLPDADVVKAPPDVKFHEEPGSFQMVDEVVDQREQVPVLHGHRIKHLVFLYKPEAAVLLFDEEDQRCHR